MALSDFERLLWVFAEETESSIRSCFKKADNDYEWVNGQAEVDSLMQRFRGVFVASLVGEIEEKLGRKFSSVFDQLSDSPTAEGSEYWFTDMPRTSTPRGRAKVMWAIRIAYTHGNGHIDQIDDPNIAAWLEPAFVEKHFRGVRVVDDYVKLFGDVTYPAIKTAVEINDQFG